MILFRLNFVPLQLVSFSIEHQYGKSRYIFKAAGYDGFDTDKEWMEQYGCVQVIEEENGHEKLRPQWKQLMASLERGDELVVSKFSNALRGSRELATFIEFCRVKVVRIVSIHDKIDSRGDLFPETKPPMYWRCSVLCRRNVPCYARLQPHHPSETEYQPADQREKS